MSTLAVHEDELIQPSFFERSLYMSSEFLVLAHELTEAAVKLEASRAAQNFAGVRSAYLDIERLSDQAVLCRESLQRSIEAETKIRGAKHV